MLMQHIPEKILIRDVYKRQIHRIVQFMGYQDYLKRSEIKDTKLDTLKMLASLEESPLRLVERLHERGKGVHVWTVNQSSEMEQMHLMGVDNIITCLLYTSRCV